MSIYKDFQGPRIVFFIKFAMDPRTCGTILTQMPFYYKASVLKQGLLSKNALNPTSSAHHLYLMRAEVCKVADMALA